MKLTEVKHKHLLTDILKVLLFSIIMLVPILSVATRCLYVICNKNANQNYSGTSQTQINYKYQSNVINSGNDLIVNNIYKLNNFNVSDFDGQEFIDFSFKIINGDINFPSLTNIENYIEDYYLYSDTDYNIRIENYNGHNYCKIYFTNLNYLEYSFTSYNDDDTDLIIQVLNINEYNFTQEGLIKDLFEYTDYNEIASVSIVEDTLDNVFEYSVNKLNDNPLINWTQQTAIYTGVNTMTTQLGITNAVIPMLIVYWFLMTVIYIIIDIVIKLFTYLTHMIGNKTT